MRGSRRRATSHPPATPSRTTTARTIPSRGRRAASSPPRRWTASRSPIPTTCLASAAASRSTLPPTSARRPIPIPRSPARTASWRAALWISETAPRSAGGGWTLPYSRGFSQYEIPPYYHLPSAVWKSVCFRGKDGFYSARTPRRGKSMGGGLSTDCGRKNMGFSAPFEAVLTW